MFRFDALPLALPTLAAAIAVAVCVSPLIGRRIGERWWRTALFLGSLALVVAVTCTPTAAALSGHQPPLYSRVWVWGIPNPGAMLSLNWQSLNILLFMPAGASAGLLERSTTRRCCITIALTSSLAVELVQVSVTALGRSQFNSATVILGAVGIGVGFLTGTTLRKLVASRVEARAATQ